MRLNSLLFRSISALILALSASQGVAAPRDLVEVTGEVGFSCLTGNGGFEHYCGYGENVESGPFRMIYDPWTPDTDNSDNAGLFRGTIRSFAMNVSQVNRPDLQFSLVGRGDFSREFSFVTGLDSLVWHMTLIEENGVVGTSLFTFRMYRETWGNPNVMPTPDFWPDAVAYIAYGAGVEETDWLNSGDFTVRTVPRPVPAPPSLWLMLIGAAAALCLRGAGKTGVSRRPAAVGNAAYPPAP